MMADCGTADRVATGAASDQTNAARRQGQEGGQERANYALFLSEFFDVGQDLLPKTLERLHVTAFSAGGHGDDQII
jgi:hypothetical protein